MRNRITIQTTKDLDDALEEARAATGRATRSEVIRDALELYDLVVQHLMSGKHLYIGPARESAGEVLLPHLERAARRHGPPAAAAKRDAASTPLSMVPTQPVESSSEGEAMPVVGRQSTAAKLPL